MHVFHIHIYIYMKNVHIYVFVHVFTECKMHACMNAAAVFFSIGVFNIRFTTYTDPFREEYVWDGLLCSTLLQFKKFRLAFEHPINIWRLFLLPATLGAFIGALIAFMFSLHSAAFVATPVFTWRWQTAVSFRTWKQRRNADARTARQRHPAAPAAKPQQCSNTERAPFTMSSACMRTKLYHASSLEKNRHFLAQEEKLCLVQKCRQMSRVDR